VSSFLLLLLSGLALLFPPLSFLAADGVSRLIHRLAVLPFVLLPVLYAILLPRQARELLTESFTYTRDDLEWFKHMPAYVMGRTKGLPPQGRLNAGQKIHHASTFVMFVTVAASGFGLWFGVGRLGPDGHALTAMVHDLSMLGLSVLMIGHVYFTFLYEALSGMVTGFVSEQYARMEHLKWFEALSAPAAVGVVATPADTDAAAAAPASLDAPDEPGDVEADQK
jgi:formate dehydrogenase subunit gamma